MELQQLSFEGLDSVLASSTEFLCNICQGNYPQTFYKCVLASKESFFETIGSDLISAEPWTEIESDDTLAFLFVKIQLEGSDLAPTFDGGCFL